MKRLSNSANKLKLPWDQLIPWSIPFGMIILWEILARAGLIDSRILPLPTDVLEAAVRLTISGEMTRHISISTWRALIGFLVGGSVGLFFGAVNGIYRPAELLTDSSLQMIRNIPHLSMISLVILWFGIGDEARIFLVALGVIFPIYVNTFYGIRAVEPDLIEMGRVYGLNSRELFSQIVLPGALPSVLVGLRYALGNMWLTLIVSETIAAGSGIGYLAMNAREFMQTDVVVLAILLYALLGKLADSLVRWLEKNLIAWHPSQNLS